MDAAVATTLEDGRATVPPQILSEMGLKGTERVYWTCDGVSATFSLVPGPPLTVHSEEEFWSKVREGEKQIARGECQDAYEVLAQLREQYGV